MKRKQDKSPVDWPALEAEFIAGAMTTKELAASHGITHDRVRKRAEKYGWLEERRRQAQRIAGERMRKWVAERTGELVESDQSDLLASKRARALLNSEMARMEKAVEAGKPVAVSRLRWIIAAFRDAQQVARLALGATTGNTGLLLEQPDTAASPAEFWQRIGAMRAAVPQRTPEAAPEHGSQAAIEQRPVEPQRALPAPELAQAHAAQPAQAEAPSAPLVGELMPVQQAGDSFDSYGPNSPGIVMRAQEEARRKARIAELDDARAASRRRLDEESARARANRR